MLAHAGETLFPSAGKADMRRVPPRHQRAVRGIRPRRLHHAPSRPDTFEHVQTLSISKEKVSSCAFNESGEWIALGCARLGQLIVWEWQSEAYVYKQQGHYFDVNACAYAPDGSMLATAADDHKVKVVDRDGVVFRHLR